MVTPLLMKITSFPWCPRKFKQRTFRLGRT